MEEPFRDGAPGQDRITRVGFHHFGADSAPTLLLVHGADTTWERSFSRAIPLLSRHFHVVAYGMSGFDSTEDTTFRNARAEAERIIGFIDSELDGMLTCLYAHSLGCQTATYVAHHERVLTTILDGAVYANTGSFTPAMARLEEPMARFLASDTLRKIASFTGLPVLSGGVSDAIYLGASRQSYRNTAWSNLAWSADLHTLEPRPQARVHLWWGERERRAVRPTQRLMTRIFPSLQSKEFRGFSHGDLCARHPELLTQEITVVARSHTESGPQDQSAQVDHSPGR